MNDEWIRQNEVNILKYLPHFLSKDNDYKNTGDICSKEHERIRRYIKDCFNQLFVDTATWGLKYWEDFLNVKPKDGDNYTTRRNRIKMILNSNDVSTKKFMTDLINKFLNDNSGKIIEHNEEYYFDVYFNNDSIFDLDGLKEAINIYKPAHLGVKYFAVQDIKTDVCIYGLANIIEKMEIEAEAGYSINPINAPLITYGLINIVSKIELDFDTNVE